MRTQRLQIAVWLIFTGLAFGSGGTAWAQLRAVGVPVRINPLGSADLSNMVVPGQTGRNYQRYFVIGLRASCLTPPPESGRIRIGRNEMIRFEFALRTSSTSANYSLNFPSDTALYIPSGTLSAQTIPVQGPTQTRASQIGNLVRLEIQVSVPTLLPGEIPGAGTVPELVNPRFSLLPRTGPSLYVNQPGPLAPQIRIYQPFGSFSAELHAQFDAHIKSPEETDRTRICGDYLD